MLVSSEQTLWELFERNFLDFWRELVSTIETVEELYRKSISSRHKKEYAWEVKNIIFQPAPKINLIKVQNKDKTLN